MKKYAEQYFQPVPSVNFHLWQPCNMRCRFCFATFQDVKKERLPKGHLPRQEAIQVVEALCKAGFSKITFVGGEPTLCPWLADLIEVTKKNFLTTMLVTNGSRLTPEFLQQVKPWLDWVCVSIDSLNPETNKAAGRVLLNSKPFVECHYLAQLEMIKQMGFGLKINTVVHKLNYKEDMTSFIRSAAPNRWKIFRVLPVEGQNSGLKNELLISDTEFQEYLSINRGTTFQPVVEDNEDMRGSYAMVDPAGRFFDSSRGYHVYSDPILHSGVELAYKQVMIRSDKFSRRGGNYDWNFIKNS